MEVGEKKSPLPESKPDELHREHILERRVYQYPQILDKSGRLEVGLLPVDNDPQTIHNWRTRSRYCNRRVLNSGMTSQVTRKAHVPPGRPLRNHSEDSGEQLCDRGQTERGHGTGKHAPRYKTEDTAEIPDGQESGSTRL